MKIQVYFFLLLLILLYYPVIEKFTGTYEECKKEYDALVSQKEKNDEIYERNRDKISQENYLIDALKESQWKIEASNKENAFKEINKQNKSIEPILADYENKKTNCESELSNFGPKLGELKKRCKDSKKDTEELRDSLKPLIKTNSNILKINNSIQIKINNIQKQIDKEKIKYNSELNKVKLLTNRLYIKNKKHLK